ncbi:MAG: squalene synthase HpnC [Rubripirellula sp.]
MNARQDNREASGSSNQGLSVSAKELQEAQAETRRIARSRRENFVVASVFLPRKLRQHFYNVYALCRVADELADETPSPAVALDHLEEYQLQLDDAFAGRPQGSLFVALTHTIRQYDLAKQSFDDLLTAFRQDQQVTRYANDGQLDAYCRCSANPVGRIVLQFGGCLDERNGQLSDRVCTGLQLANFWQDVARDYQIGRIYLPTDDMSRFGVVEEMLVAPTTPVELRQLLASQCNRAEELLCSGLELARLVPAWLAKDVMLFTHGGLETLNAIRAIDYDVLSTRPVVSKWKQASLMLRACLNRL